MFRGASRFFNWNSLSDSKVVISSFMIEIAWERAIFEFLISPACTSFFPYICVTYDTVYS